MAFRIPWSVDYVWCIAMVGRMGGVGFVMLGIQNVDCK